MIDNIEKLKLENEQLLLNLKLVQQKKEKRKKTILISVIAILISIIIISAIIFYIKTHDISFLLNKTWNGVSDSFYLYDSNDDSINISSHNIYYIEFYDNKKYIEYTMEFDDENKKYNILDLTIGTFKIKNNFIKLKAQKFSRDARLFEKTNYERKLTYDKSNETFYYYQTTNKYIDVLTENDGLVSNDNKEKVEYKITYIPVMDDYFYDYYDDN